MRSTLLAWGALVAVACSKTATVVDYVPEPADAGVGNDSRGDSGGSSSGGARLVPRGDAGDEARGGVNDDGKCPGEFAELAKRCPPRFDDRANHRLPNGCPRWVYESCGGLDGYAAVIGESITTCCYDDASSELVGVEYADDVARFCDDTSDTISAGRVPSSPCADDMMESCAGAGGR